MGHDQGGLQQGTSDEAQMTRSFVEGWPHQTRIPPFNPEHILLGMGRFFTEVLVLCFTSYAVGF